ncbi:hypothetical protein FK529_17955 [Tsukamurella asaccharolytica]|uniref:Condensation domain-containing protein n=1 Tax=Tsukamurella asaccharolytica TaxID=2592067 RepID=A0A5C5R4B1_9ACTN|nr:hypothetical protein [Tsukamurella asaccharolytica]TWS17970.1 hypothetical protein FK529_17955 [Tsukamurella asaccharolytica]
MPETVRVGELDRRFAGGPIVCVVGPVHGTQQMLLPRLTAMYRSGPQNRVGVLPDPAGQRWLRIAPDRSWIARDPDFDPEDIGAAVRRLHDRVNVPPIQVAVEREHLLMRVDHGVGDMGLVFEIIAALSQPGGPTTTGFVDPAPRYGLRGAVLRIVSREVFRDPVGTARCFRAVTRGRRRRAEPAAEFRALPGGVVDAHSVFVRSDSDYLTALTAARGAGGGSASVSALLAQAFAEEIAALEPGVTDVHVVVSLRGRVGGDRDTAGNLTAVVTVPVQPLSAFAARFDVRVRSAEAPIKLALSLISRTATPRAGGASAPGPSLSVSNVTRAAAGARIGWAGVPDRRTCAVGAPLNDRGAIAVMLTQVAAQVTATAHFDAAVYAPVLVEQAVARALSGDRWTR